MTTRSPLRTVEHANDLHRLRGAETLRPPRGVPMNSSEAASLSRPFLHFLCNRNRHRPGLRRRTHQSARPYRAPHHRRRPSQLAILHPQPHRQRRLPRLQLQQVLPGPQRDRPPHRRPQSPEHLRPRHRVPPLQPLELHRRRPGLRRLAQPDLPARRRLPRRRDR